MSKKFWVAGEQVQLACRETMKQFHPELAAFKVNVLCVFAKAEDKKGNFKPAVKVHGRAAYAAIRAVKDEDRAAGMPDAVMTIDHVLWVGLSPARQAALLDHELTHIQADGGESSAGVSLGMRKHDWELAGFAEVVTRHGLDAIELVDLVNFGRSEPGQMAFRFIEEGGGDAESPAVAVENGLADRAAESFGGSLELGGSVEIELDGKPLVRVEKSEAGKVKSFTPAEGQSDEALISQALEVLRDTKRASTSGLQRRLKIGYNRAAGLLDLLEERGIVGPATDAGPREILNLPEKAA
jgi:DNA segregation ATPase FtsK/SpoIIIE-like protein